MRLENFQRKNCEIILNVNSIQTELRLIHRKSYSTNSISIVSIVEQIVVRLHTNKVINIGCVISEISLNSLNNKGIYQ